MLLVFNFFRCWVLALLVVSYCIEMLSNTPPRPLNQVAVRVVAIGTTFDALTHRFGVGNIAEELRLRKAHRLIPIKIAK